MKKLNLGIVGVLVPTKNETKINNEIKNLKAKHIGCLGDIDLEL